ncbi:hypothetical protein RvY_01858 [Ramazzottius varieornatus]|uniref:DDE-1 domain-containing protein n=1 Tax=Ramazzottius varieornatus TaxID=947166 RepID=A0A1D1UNS1_RAMVA|nr:hypothetical protein RvY_01858 [Ramazzottius varieornatus]
MAGLPNTSFNDKYFCRFLTRHENLSLRIAHASNRKKDREWTTTRCHEYIAKLQILKDQGFLERPEQMCNLDESAFDTARMYDRVVARKAVKQIPSQFDGTEKEYVTVLPFGDAAGLALFSGKLQVQSRLDGTFNMCYQAVNSSGYMDQVLFANHIKKEVFPAITESKNVIFVDGHFSHVNWLLLARYCKEFLKETGKRVEIFCLPTGQTNHLQPFDVSVFGGIKKKWHNYLASRNVVAGGMVTTDTPLSHLVTLWFRVEGCDERFAFNAGECLKSGFEKCGLFPFNPEVIRATVKAHHDPEKISRKFQIQKKKDREKLFEVLHENYNYASMEDMEEIQKIVLLKAKGITPGKILANALQKRLFKDAPVKQRRVRNRQLDLQSGGMVSQDEFVAELENEEAKKAAKKKSDAAIRSARINQATEENVAANNPKALTSAMRKIAVEDIEPKKARKAKKCEIA